MFVVYQLYPVYRNVVLLFTVRVRLVRPIVSASVTPLINHTTGLPKSVVPVTVIVVPLGTEPFVALVSPPPVNVQFVQETVTVSTGAEVGVGVGVADAFLKTGSYTVVSSRS